MAQKRVRNRQIEIAINHLELAKEELNRCADTVYNSLQTVENKIADEHLHEILTKALASLQMQDIISQRIERLKKFLAIVDENVSLPTDETYLKEFAWEKEVDQNDIDQMFNEYKG